MKLILRFLTVCSLAFAGATRTQITFDFEYQLDVNAVKVTGTTENVLRDIDRNILDSLQEAVPNDGTVTSDQLPAIHFEAIESEIYHTCLTGSEQCSLVQSTISISYVGGKTAGTVQYITQRLVQDYLSKYSHDHLLVLITYSYPSVVETLALFQMNVVTERMGGAEISLLQRTFVKKFRALEGDAEVVDAQFIYQDLYEVVDEDRRLDTMAEEPEDTVFYILTTVVKIRGFCRNCTASEFTTMVNQEANEKLQSFYNRLIQNAEIEGSSFFDDVNKLSIAVAELPSELPSIVEKPKSDADPLNSGTKHSLFSYFGIVCTIIVVLGGIVFLRSKADDRQEEGFKLSESEVSIEDMEVIWG